MLRFTQNLRRGAALLAGAAAVAAGAPAAADADSIAYVKDGNVWLSTSDGARQYQVTTAGGYSTVSQSDDGEMVALHGVRLHYLGRDGTLKADIDTPVSAGPQDGRQWFGPFDPKLSPDGRKVAYHWYYRQYGWNPYCNGGSGCYETYLRQGTGYSRPDQLTSFEDEHFKAQTGWINPTWIDDGDTVVLSDPSPSFGNEDIVLHTPYPYSGTDGLTRWGSDPDVRLQEGEFDPTHRKVAYVAGENRELLRIYRTPQGLYPYFPRGCYQFGDPVGGSFSGPSWSPDGSKLAYAEGDGIYVADVPPLTADPCNEGATLGRLLIPGAKSADWGPADVPPARPPVEQPRPPVEQPRPPVRPQPRPQPRADPEQQPRGGGGVVTTPSGDRVALAAKAITAKALSARGVTLDVSCTAACRVTTTLRVDGKTARRLRLGKRRDVGRASARLAGKGSKRVAVKVDRRLRARFARAARRSTVQLRVTIAPAGGKATTKTLALKVK